MAKQSRKITASKINKKPIEQYSHTDKDRVNNPPVGLVTPETDNKESTKTYQYDPHLDPQLNWAGKAERLSFDVDTVSLHVHERIDPRSIIEAVRKKNGNNYEQLSLFNDTEENPPLREAVEFYQHRHNWSNRLIAGDSLLVMNSLIEKEALAGQVQMVYFDPPYGIKYGSNFQPFVNKRDVKDGKDEDLTSEPETIKAFRDTWELGIHSYLTYLRDRLLLARELLTESGSCFVQISDENVYHVREIMDEVFGKKNYASTLIFLKTSAKGSVSIDTVNDYILWYAKDVDQVKYRQLYMDKILGETGTTQYNWIESPDQLNIRRLTAEEITQQNSIPAGWKVFAPDNLTSQTGSQTTIFDFEYCNRIFKPYSGGWKTNSSGLNMLANKNRLLAFGNTLMYKRYLEDFPVYPINNIWLDTLMTGFSEKKVYVVQTGVKAITKCVLMTTDPGDIVFDPTCGSGTTAFVAEQWGRRWITCDTSRVAVTLAKQRLMTALFDYYELAHPSEGVGSGFRYQTVPHITLKSIANNEPPAMETLYDKPLLDKSKHRVTGPFTVEAVPAPVVKSVDQLAAPNSPLATPNTPLTTNNPPPTAALSRTGETLRQTQWRDELLKSGIRGKNKQEIRFTRVEPFAGTKWLHADAEIIPEAKKKNLFETEKQMTFDDLPQRVVISFGPEHAPLEQRQVALALEEAQTLVPKPKMVIFAALQFDAEAAKDIDETNFPGITLLKVQMNADLLTDDLKKKRSSNESFWLIGSPDVRVVSGEWLVDSKNKRMAKYGDFKKLSGIDSLAEINKLSKDDIRFYTAISERRDLWIDLADKKSRSFDSGKHSGGAGKEPHGGIHSVSGDSKGLPCGTGNLDNIIRKFESHKKGSFRDFINELRRNKQIAEWSQKLSLHSPLTTHHFYTVEVAGFDYYNTKTGQIESGGKDKIALWMLDTDYDGRSLFPRQVFFPMSGEKDGWSRLAKNLKAEIDEDLIEAYRGTISLPFETGKYQRVAVKIVDDRGIESLKIVRVE